MAGNIYDMPSGDDFKKIFNKFSKIFSGLIIAILIALLGFSSFYSINEQEQAVITTFGKAKTVSESGLHFKIPLIQKVQKVDTTIQGAPIGYDMTTGNSIEEESMMITNDFNFVNVDFFLEYRVSDPIKYLYASDDPELILKNIAQSNIRSVVGGYIVDDVITTGKFEIQSTIKDQILNDLLEHDIGLQLVNITIQDSEPPTVEVMEAFKSVETAKQGKDTTINNANKYRNEEMPKAKGEVDRIIQEAESDKARRINEAEAEVARFNEMYDEYKKYPLITKQRMFYETMEDVLPSLKVIINSDDGGVEKILPLEPFSEGGNN